MDIINDDFTPDPDYLAAKPKVTKKDGIVRTETKSGFIYLSTDDSSGNSSPLPLMEKKRAGNLKLVFTAKIAAKDNTMITKMPSFKRLPTTGEVLDADYSDTAAGKRESKEQTETIALFVSAVKALPGLKKSWIAAAGKARQESSALPIVVRHGLSREDAVNYKEANDKIKAIVQTYNDEQKACDEPDDIIASRRKRDRGIREVCGANQHLAVLFVDFSSLPEGLLSKLDLDRLRKDRKALAEYKEKVVNAFIERCLSAYTKGLRDEPNVQFSYEEWLRDYIEGL
jgi:hypothetical protein